MTKKQRDKIVEQIKELMRQSINAVEYVADDKFKKCKKEKAKETHKWINEEGSKAIVMLWDIKHLT